MPVLNGVVVLHARISAEPGALGNLAHELACIDHLHRLARRRACKRPCSTFTRPRLRGVHEPVREAHRLVHVLEVYAPVGVAVERAVVAGINQRVGLLLLFLLGLDKLYDVWMPVG